MEAEGARRRSVRWHVALVVLGAIVLGLLFAARIFLFEPFNMPSGSMHPTLVVGDYFFVSKYSYGWSRYSLPFAQPAFAGRILGREPERGDVVVYRHSTPPTVDFVKRVVGLPGDTIQLKDGILYINGVGVPRVFVGNYTDPESMARTRRWRETLPGGRSYDILDTGKSRLDNTEVITVPAERYFVLGDNRENSMDSRMPELQGGGTVPYENLIGRADLIFYSSDVTRIGMTVR